MILHVVDRAMEANIGKPIVCTDNQAIFDAVSAYGTKAIMTSEGHPSGSDRIWEGVCLADPDAKAEFVVNLQGDLPTIAPAMTGVRLRQERTPMLQEAGATSLSADGKLAAQH